MRTMVRRLRRVTFASSVPLVRVSGFGAVAVGFTGAGMGTGFMAEDAGVMTLFGAICAMSGITGGVLGAGRWGSLSFLAHPTVRSVSREMVKAFRIGVCMMDARALVCVL